MALVRDPAFWRRFSTAVRLDEEAAKEPTEPSREPSFYSHAWIQRQDEKKRNTCIFGFLIAFAICIAIAAIVLVIWWFSLHNWLRNGR